MTDRTQTQKPPDMVNENYRFGFEEALLQIKYIGLPTTRRMAEQLGYEAYTGLASTRTELELCTGYVDATDAVVEGLEPFFVVTGAPGPAILRDVADRIHTEKCMEVRW